MKLLLGRVRGALSGRYPRTYQFVGARLSPEGYLGLHLTIGLILSLAALVAFGVVVRHVFLQESLVAVDAAVARTLRSHVTPALSGFFRAATFLGNGPTVAVIGAALIGLLVGMGRHVLLVGWLAALGGGWLLEIGLKLLFRRARPLEALIPLPSSYSFPSGHALVSLVTWGMIAYLAWLVIDSARLRAAVVATIVALVLAIGFSRVYLGVHHFSDVLGGYAAGFMWLTACVSGLEVARRRSRHRAKQAAA